MKRNLALLFLIILITVCTLSCTTPPRVIPTPKLTGDENIITVNASFDEVYDAFVRYFSDKGLPLANTDKFTGNITTRNIEITDKSLNQYYLNVTGDNKNYLKAILNFGYCDCGQPNTHYVSSKNLSYKYIVDIKRLNNKSTQFRVDVRFWTELHKIQINYVTYEGDWECASSGEYEKKVIEEIKTNYLKK